MEEKNYKIGYFLCAISYVLPILVIIICLVTENSGLWDVLLSPVVIISLISITVAQEIYGDDKIINRLYIAWFTIGGIIIVALIVFFIYSFSSCLNECSHMPG